MNLCLGILFMISSLLGFGQQQAKIDVIKGEIEVYPQPYTKSIEGTVQYTIKILENIDSLFLDAQQMRFTKVALNGTEIAYKNDGQKLIISSHFKKGNSYNLKVAYETTPKQALYFIDWDDEIKTNDQIWTQGQGKYTSHWLPSFDDMNEKVIFSITVTCDPKYSVVANGNLEKTKVDDGLKHWQYRMEKPMSSYLLAFTVGIYDKKTTTAASGIPLELYYYPADSTKVEYTYRHTKTMFDFLEAEIGIAYPWQNYKQIPVKDFLYAGMENTGTTIFSDSYMVDAVGFNDKNYINVNAHELAHQWFGNLVTEVDSKSHWLHEGFATYYALLAEGEVFGEDEFYWKLYSSALILHEQSKRDKGQRLTDPKASSLTFYEKGAWALYALRKRVGDSSFKKGIKTYLQDFAYTNVTVTDFMGVMENVSGMDLSAFRELWLEQEAFPYEVGMRYLKADNGALRSLIALEEKLMDNEGKETTYLEAYLTETTSDKIKGHLIKKYSTKLTSSFLLNNLLSDGIYTRQALSFAVDSIPQTAKSKFETLLNDKSYSTQENALYKLWVAFPEDRATYLNKSAVVIGLKNRSFRMLWLALALLTEGYNEVDKPGYYSELSGYSNKRYHFEVRQLALQWLSSTFQLSDTNLKDLINATQHHSWQFKKYARGVLKEIMEDMGYRNRIINMKATLTGTEQNYIENLIATE